MNRKADIRRGGVQALLIRHPEGVAENEKQLATTAVSSNRAPRYPARVSRDTTHATVVIHGTYGRNDAPLVAPLGASIS